MYKHIKAIRNVSSIESNNAIMGSFRSMFSIFGLVDYFVIGIAVEPHSTIKGMNAFSINQIILIFKFNLKIYSFTKVILIRFVEQILSAVKQWLIANRYIDEQCVIFLNRLRQFFL